VDTIDLTEVEHTVEHVWVAQPIQGRQPVIRVGKLADGRWWAGRDDGHRWTGTWAYDTEEQAEAAADRWSRLSGLRWRKATPSGQPSRSA
jgi:hypothetical protein